MPTPPIAKRVPSSVTKHNHTRHDDYAWLRNKETDPDVLTYLKEENTYTDEFMESTKELQENIFQEITKRIQLEDVSVPFLWRDYYYYFRTKEEDEYRVFCRRSKENIDREEVLHDENFAAKDKAYYHVGEYDVSFNGKKLAWTEDEEGGEYYHLFIKDLGTQQVKREFSQKISSDVIWSHDNNILFYVRYDAAHRPCSVWAHHLGDPSKADKCLFEENDERFWVGIDRSKSDRFLLIEVGSKQTSETHLIDLAKNDFLVTLVLPRQEGIKYAVYHHDDSLFILTNQEAKNYRLMKTSLAAPNNTNWTEVLPHNPKIKLEGVEVFNDFLVITERGEAEQHLRVLSLKNNENSLLKFDEPCFDVFPTDNYDVNSHVLRFAYHSLTTPTQVVDYDLISHEKKLLKQVAVLGEFNKDNYCSERHVATAADGTQIPISLVYHRNTKLSAETPLYLYGYGAYGISLDPWFSHARLSLLNRGFVFAIAHARGGGDCGETWHEQGKLHYKENTFTDFIACGEFLINKNFTSAKKLVIAGGSAGGLLMGAVLNKRPDLFAAAVADVPFVDCLNTMLDATLPLTIGEYEEWGNPEADASAYQDIAAYAPYEQVKQQAYPALLITAGLNDPRVPYWEPAKWCAKLRVSKTNQTPLLLKTELSAGHGGPSGRFAAYREVAFEYAFLLKVLGMV